tara:strand:+ start:253 stop:1596 length:1344 start_codon:yes stop_codon:yes gene_type:complete
MNYLDFVTMPLQGSAIVALATAIGMTGVIISVAYFLGDPRSPATRALAFSVGTVGIANACYPVQHVLHPYGFGTWWLVSWPVLDALVMSGLFVWMIHVTRGAQPSARAQRWVRMLAWLFAAATSVYLILGAFFPVERMTRFLFCLGHEQSCSGQYFWMFATPIALMASLLMSTGIIVLTQKIDDAERERVIWTAIATPFFFANYVLPAGYNVMSSLPGLFIFMVGGVRYHIIQGERGRFMSRFLSQEVVKQVSTRGLAYTMQPQKLELTVVCCDLRGFTHFSKAHDSNEVTRLLGEYYEAVGDVVGRYHATIQDYAGDGIMILVGAPIAMESHARIGLELSRDVLQVSEAIAQRWSRPETPLAVGLGIASGIVTVGTIGSSTRMEYTAIGTAANLASRLCDHAGAGEILIDMRTVELAGADGLDVRAPIPIKGMGDVAHYVQHERRA